MQNKMKRKVKKNFMFILFFTYFIGNFLCAQNARADLLSLQIEPIVGYEQAQELLPTRHKTTRLFYGGRVTAGFLLLSLEGEYTRGENEEVTPDFSQKNSVDRLKVGLRSGFGIGRLLQFHIRGGGQASKGKNELTTGGVTTTTHQAVTYRPYGGAGLRIRLTKSFSATADAVAVFPKTGDLNQTEYQTTAGFAIRLP